MGGVPVVGVIYNPVLDELFVARQGVRGTSTITSLLYLIRAHYALPLRVVHFSMADLFMLMRLRKT